MRFLESREYKRDPTRGRWDEVVAEVDHIVDRLGKPVDPGIKEVVTAFRYLDFPTDGSCEGHMDGKSNAPWVHFSFIPAGMKQRFLKAQERAGGKWNDREVQSLLQEANEEITRGSERLMALLSEFYKNREVPTDRRLVLHFFPDSVRLQSQGAYIQERYSPGQKEKRMKGFQEEMDAFTEFIKARIFAEQDGEEQGPEST